MTTRAKAIHSTLFEMQKATDRAIDAARRSRSEGEISLEIYRDLAHVVNGVALVIDDLGHYDESSALADQAPIIARLGGMQANASAELDEHAAEELLLYLQNDSRFWGPGSQGEAIERNYAKKWKRGTFNEERAADGYMHVLKTAAQQYVKEMGSPSDRWYVMFNAPTRRAAAIQLVEQFVAEAELGNFRD